jgi:hypothetical protein
VTCWWIQFMELVAGVVFVCGLSSAWVARTFGSPLWPSIRIKGAPPYDSECIRLRPLDFSLIWYKCVTLLLCCNFCQILPNSMGWARHVEVMSMTYWQKFGRQTRREDSAWQTWKTCSVRVRAVFICHSVQQVSADKEQLRQLLLSFLVVAYRCHLELVALVIIHRIVDFKFSIEFETLLKDRWLRRFEHFQAAGECVAWVPYMFPSVERTCRTPQHSRCKQQRILSQLGGGNKLPFLQESVELWH